jgi:hypothetical protein
MAKHSTHSGGNEVANMLNNYVSVASCVGEQRFNRGWLLLSTPKQHVHPQP